MEYQQLPPVSMIIGSPNTAPHVHAMNGNSNANGNNHISSNQLLTMQPPLLPLQVAHNLHQLTTHNSQSNSVHHGSNNQNQSSQSLPPTAQLLQAIHNNTQQQQQQQQQQNNGQNMSSNTNGTTNNNTNSSNNDENNRWTQYQVQQLWRHHAYLNGNVTRCVRTENVCILTRRNDRRANQTPLKMHGTESFRKEISKPCFTMKPK
jgi:hypothetical protein